MRKSSYVLFANKDLETSFEKLKKGDESQKMLFKQIEKAILKIKINPACGTKLQKRIWPRFYTSEQVINNLFKYNLDKNWRLIYTIKEDELQILNIILEWFNHKDYEKRFSY